jgi:hypothetical protein
MDQIAAFAAMAMTPNHMFTASALSLPRTCSGVHGCRNKSGMMVLGFNLYFTALSAQNHPYQKNFITASTKTGVFTACV